MIRLRRNLIFLLLVGIVALLALWRPWANEASDIQSTRSDQPERSTPPPARPDVALPPAIASLEVARSPRRLSLPGPVGALVARADAGDAIAACQLAAELGECRTRQYFHELDPSQEAMAPTPRCAELLARHGDRHLEWLRQAAHAGEPEAMLRYAAGEAFGVHGASFDYLRSPGFENWRREAPGMLQAVIEAGYPEAVIYRMIANQPDFGGPLANLLPADPVQDQAYNELFLLLNVDSPLVELMRTNLRSQADEAVGVQARQQAARWHQDHFGGRTYDFEALNAEGRRGFPVMQAHGAGCSVAIEGPTP